MKMSLTKQDLAAIKKIFDDRVDLSDQITAESFEDVYSRLDSLDAKMETIDDRLRNVESIQQAELERNDSQDISLQKIMHALHID